MERIEARDIVEMRNPGVVSRQLINPENSESQRLTITEVHLDAGAIQPRHVHASSEQVWYAIQGLGMLLLSDDIETPFRKGDIVRFAGGEVHGLRNDSDDELIYISVTSPPIHFGYAYTR